MVDTSRAVGFVQGAFDRLRRDAQRGGLVAVDAHHHLGILDLQIAGDVLQAGQGAQLRLHPRRPAVKLRHVGILEGVLVLALAELAADLDRLHVLQEGTNAGNRRQLAAQVLDHAVGGRTFPARLEVHEDAPGVARQGEAAGADEGHVGIDGGIAADHLRRRLLVRHHIVEGHVFRALDETEDLPGVLVRQQTLGHDPEQGGAAGQGGGENQQGGAAVVQRELQAALGGAPQGHEESFGSGVEPSVVRLPRRPQVAAAEHGREGERDEAGHQHGGDDGHGELVQQAPNHPAHEQHRDEHRGQREGHGEDGEADLPRPVERRLQRLLAHFQVPGDVL